MYHLQSPSYARSLSSVLPTPNAELPTYPCLICPRPGLRRLVSVAAVIKVDLNLSFSFSFRLLSTSFSVRADTLGTCPYLLIGSY